MLPRSPRRVRSAAQLGAATRCLASGSACSHRALLFSLREGLDLTGVGVLLVACSRMGVLILGTLSHLLKIFCSLYLSFFVCSSGCAQSPTDRPAATLRRATAEARERLESSALESPAPRVGSLAGLPLGAHYRPRAALRLPRGVFFRGPPSKHRHEVGVGVYRGGPPPAV